MKKLNNNIDNKNNQNKKHQVAVNVASHKQKNNINWQHGRSTN